MLIISEFIEVNQINIDIDIFNLLNKIINEEWVYITETIVSKWMGYKLTKDIMYNFSIRIKKDFEENIDYKEVDKNHEIVQSELNKEESSEEKKNKTKGGHNKKYYIVTNKTLIGLLCRSKSVNSIRILEHLYETYNLLLKYHIYQCNELKLNYENEIKKIKELENNILFTELQKIKYLKLQEKEKENVVYFIYEQNDLNYFKIGFTNDIKRRLSQLQNGNRRRLCIYRTFECENPSKVETYLHRKFKKNNILNEWFYITCTDIDQIIEKLSSM